MYALAMKGLTWFHRWVGIVLCLMFATWFATGAVMVFVAFPSLPDVMRVARSETVELSRVHIEPRVAATRLGDPPDLRLVSSGGVPIYVATGQAGREVAISAETGQALPDITPSTALRIASRFGGAEVLRVAGPFDYDQWIVHQQFNPWRPFYRVRLSDPHHTDLYVSARTGEVLQRTLGYERGWNWVGSVVHWIYYVPIRKTFALWDWAVWIIGLIGLSTAVVGIWLGLSQTLKKMRSRRPALSPFRGLLRWHHTIGLIAGVFVLCWITSGWLSMDHGRIFSEGQASEAAMRAYREGAGARTAPRLTVADLMKAGPASSIDFQRIDGDDIAAARGPSGSQVVLASAAGTVVDGRIPQPLVRSAIRTAWPSATIKSVEPVAADSPYAKAEALPSDALLFRLGGPDNRRLYIDGVSGKVLVVMDRSRETYAWVYYMLHTYNFPGLSSRPALRIAILLVPLTAGFVFSVTGILVGIRRLRSLAPPPSKTPRSARSPA